MDPAKRMPEPRSETAPDSAPEITYVTAHRVWCDGAGDIRGGENYRPAALGHPRVWMEIDEKGHVDCGYCDRRFVLEGHSASEPNDTGAA